MSDNIKIKEGDKVRVYWEHLQPIQGTVRYTPSATGDSWYIEGPDGKTVHAIQTFARMHTIPSFDHPWFELKE